MHHSMDSAVLSLPEAADLLTVSEDSLLDAIARGDLPALEGSGQWFVLSADLYWFAPEGEVRL